MKKLITLSFALISMMSMRAQTIEGDALINLVGSKVDAPATQKFFTAYEIKNTAGTKYSSYKDGIDIDTKNDSLTTMTVYHSNSLYGSYTHKLPKGLVFGESSNDVFKKLGKPTTSYINSGYSEYEYGKRVLVCWFEDKVLSQVMITLK